MDIDDPAHLILLMLGLDSLMPHYNRNGPMMHWKSDCEARMEIRYAGIDRWMDPSRTIHLSIHPVCPYIESSEDLWDSSSGHTIGQRLLR